MGDEPHRGAPARRPRRPPVMRLDRRRARRPAVAAPPRPRSHARSRASPSRPAARRSTRQRHAPGRAASPRPPSHRRHEEPAEQHVRRDQRRTDQQVRVAPPRRPLTGIASSSRSLTCGDRDRRRGAAIPRAGDDESLVQGTHGPGRAARVRHVLHPPGKEHRHDTQGPARTQDRGLVEHRARRRTRRRPHLGLERLSRGRDRAGHARARRAGGGAALRPHADRRRGLLRLRLLRLSGAGVCAACRCCAPRWCRSRPSTSCADAATGASAPCATATPRRSPSPIALAIGLGYAYGAVARLRAGTDAAQVGAGAATRPAAG